MYEFPAVTYSRPRRTTIGPGCLTAVFGMGTGGTIRVCSPGKLFLYRLAAVVVTIRCVCMSHRFWAPVVGVREEDQCGEAFGC